MADDAPDLRELSGFKIESNKQKLKDNKELQGYLNFQKTLQEQVEAGTFSQEKATAAIIEYKKRRKFKNFLNKFGQDRIIL